MKQTPIKVSRRSKRDRKSKLNRRSCDCEECSAAFIDSCKHYIHCNLYSTSPYRLRNFHCIIDLLLFICGALYVVFVPYTKHEESFNMQATHDILFNGSLDLSSKEYLHPDSSQTCITFIAALIISVMVFPFKIMSIFVAHIHLQQQCQYLIRFALLFINIAALSKFRQSFVLSYFVQQADIYILSKTQHQHPNKYKKSARAQLIHTKIAMIQRFSLLFTVLIMAQFHFLFYSSRLLPNCLALPSITIVFAHLFRNNIHKTLLWLIVSCVLYPNECIILILVPFIIGIIACKQRKQTHWLALLLWTCLRCAAVFIGMLCIMFIDSFIWNGFSFVDIKWPTFGPFVYKSLLSHISYPFALIPKMLLINTIFIIFSAFKIYPVLFVYEFVNRYLLRKRFTSNSNQSELATQHNDFAYKRGENIGLFRLILLFIDKETAALLLICILFAFSLCIKTECNEAETQFSLLLLTPLLTLLSTIGCIRLFTLWGYRGFDNASYTLLWFKHNLYQRQKQLYFLWIPHHLLFSSVVKKLVCLEAPLTFITFRRYLKVIFKEIPREIMHKTYHRKQIGFGPLTVSISIIISICFVLHQVNEASYDYPGGVAITLFPNIIEHYKTNLALYSSYNYDADYAEYGEYQEIDRDPEPMEISHAYDEHNWNDSSASSEVSSAQRIRIRENRAIHSKRGHRMNHDYKTNANASYDDYAFMAALENEQHSMFELYDYIDCVHIGSLAAISGVTRFLTPSFYEQYRFSKENEISMDEYALLEDPCNLYQEIYSMACGSDDDDDEMYDEQYFERQDDYLKDQEEQRKTVDCSSIDYRYPSTSIKGFDYLISEHSSVPGYDLLPNGIIYAKPMHSNVKSQILYVINYILSFFKHTDYYSLEPSLYVLKREEYNPVAMNYQY